MKTILVAIGLVFGSGTIALACPTWELDGVDSFEAHGDAFYDMVSFETVAGGDKEMSECNLANIGSGYVATQPDFEFTLSGMEYYGRIEFRVEAACDAILLMNSATKSILYNDDTSGTDPVIGIDQPANGTYDLWLGTIDPEACDAFLIVETFE